MADDAALAGRVAFAERLRLQLKARYGFTAVDVDGPRFAVHVVAPGIDETLPLGPLHLACERDPARTGALIADYVAGIESRIGPRAVSGFSTQRLRWCVRTARYLAGVARAGELLTHTVGADMTAFVAEELPGSIMRGVPRQEWLAAGLSDDQVGEAAGENTARRFAKLVARIQTADRVPGDGWRMAGEPLFQGSMLLVRAVLEALTVRCGSDVLIGVPDRGVVLAIPASAPAAERFPRRVLREWREAMNPCSRELLLIHDAALRAMPRRQRRASAFVLPWLED